MRKAALHYNYTKNENEAIYFFFYRFLNFTSFIIIVIAAAVAAKLIW